MSGKPILCVDFDGVVHSYTTPWAGPAVIADPPVPGAINWLWEATEFFQVVVYSSRSKDVAGVQAMRNYVRDHAKAELGAEHPMAADEGHGVNPIGFAYEKPAAFLTIDDRALCFTGDWSALDPAALLKFKPWNKRGPVEDIVQPAIDALSRPGAVDMVRRLVAGFDIKPEEIR